MRLTAVLIALAFCGGGTLTWSQDPEDESLAFLEDLTSGVVAVVGSDAIFVDDGLDRVEPGLVRVWWGFGLPPTNELLLIRPRGADTTGSLHVYWGAGQRAETEAWVRATYHVSEVRSQGSFRVARLVPREPIDWVATWNRLASQDVAILPGGSAHDDEIMAFDDPILFVNVVGPEQRSYRYMSPHRQLWPDARKAVAIVRELRDAFGMCRLE
jgi:hypothetical protein